MHELRDYAVSKNVEFMSTPFDIESADFLNEIMNYFKISSSDITNKPFIQHISKFNKPIILSTGASTFSEIFEAIEWIKEIKVDLPILLLHCVLNYPTQDKNANLGFAAINVFDKTYNNHLNFSFTNQANFGRVAITEPGRNFTAFFQYNF